MENINVSFPNDSLGDPLRDAFIKVNDNFSELDITKVDKELGKGLSSEDFTSAEKSKLAALPTNPEILTNKQNNLLIDGTGIKYATIDAVNSHALNTANPHNVIAPQVAAGAHGVFLTSLTTQGQLDNTETQLIVEQKTSKISYRASYQTGLARPDADTSVLTISPADTLNITNVNGVLFVNEVFPDTPLNKLVDFVKDFGNKSFVANGTNTPLAANTRGIFYVGIDKTGTQVYKTSRAFDLDVSLLARILVANTAGVYSIVSFKYYPNLMSTDPTDRGRSVSAGGYIVPSGAASISFGNRSMFLKKDSVNYDVNKLDPHYKTIVDSVNPTPMNFLFLLPNITDLSTSIALSTTMNPTQWYTAGGTVGVGAVNPTHYQVYRLMLTVTGTIAIQTLASTVATPVAGVNAIFGTREEALAGLTSVVFPPVFPAGDAQPLGTFYLRAGTNPNGSELTNSNDFYFRPVGSSSSSSTVGVTAHDTLTGKNDNANFYHPTLAQVTSWDNHIVNVANPHNVTKAQVGLGNVDNTSDADKPISNATQTALNLKADKAITIATTSPLQGGGDLSANRTLSILQASASQSGFLSSTDWQLFNSRVGGALTASYVAKATGTNTLANSVIFDNGTYVGIGTNAPSSLLNIRSGTEGAYFRAVGVNDGDNYGALELWNTAATSKWQFAHKSAGSGLDKDFQFAHYNGTSWSFPLHIKTGGNVGIGTTAPTQKLHVAGSVLSTSFIKNGAPASNILLAGGGDIPQSTFAPSSGSGSYIQNQNASAQSANIWIDGSGRFGENQVGSAVRAYNPNLSAGQNISLAVGLSETVNNSGFLVWQHETNVSDRFLSLETFSSSSPIRFAGSKFFFNGGNVGIGTTNPVDKLQVLGNIRFAVNQNANDNGYYGTLESTNAMATGVLSFVGAGGAGKVIGGENYGTDTVIFSNATEKIRILNNGNVGIGTTNPHSRLHVSGGDIVIDNGGTGVIRGNNNDYGSGGGIKISSSNTGTEQYIQLGRCISGPGTFDNPILTVKVDTSNVLIGTTSDNGVDKLQVAGGIKATGQITGESFRNVGGYSFSGNPFIFMNGDGSWYQNLSALNANFYGAVNTPDYRTSGVGYITYDADNAGTGTLVIRAGTLSDVAMFGATGNFSVGSPLTANQKINTSGLFQSIDGKNQYLKIGMEGDTAVIATDWFSGYGGAYRPMSFWTGGAERLNIATNGNSTFYGSVTANGGLVVPFGAVYSRDGIWFRPDGVDRALLRAESGSGDVKLYQYNSGAGYLRDTLTIPNATGNVLIGTNSDNGVDKLQVNGSIRAQGGLYAGAHSALGGATGNAYNTATLEIMGNGGADTIFPTIGFHQPSLYAFTLSARSNGFFFTDISGNNRASIYAANIEAVGTVTATSGFFNSDARLKDVISRDGDVVIFKWKDGRDDKTHVGLIAQEVQEYMPDSVQEGADGMLSVNYIEVLLAKISQLEKRITELENK